MPMTGLELLTARHLEVAVVVVVLRDRRLAQIAQFQDTAYAHRTASEIADFDLGTLCRGMGIDHLMLARDVDVPAVLEKAKAIHHASARLWLNPSWMIQTELSSRVG